MPSLNYWCESFREKLQTLIDTILNDYLEGMNPYSDMTTCFEAQGPWESSVKVSCYAQTHKIPNTPPRRDSSVLRTSQIRIEGSTKLLY